MVPEIALNSRTELARQERLERLRAVPALADVSPPCHGAIADLARLHRFEKGEEILAEGAPSETFFILLGGHVKMVRGLANGRNLVLAVFHPGEIFGAVAALGGEACDAAIVALDTTTCLGVERGHLYALFEERPELISEILPALTRELMECKNCLVEVSCYRVETRFAQLLLKFADSVGRPRKEGTFIPVPLARQELADMTGTTIETCIRVMSRWAKTSVVETRRDGFLIRDRAVLEALVHDGST